MTTAVYQPRADAGRRAKQAATIQARATEVLRSHPSWRFCHRKADGHPFFMLEGSPVRQPDGK